MNIRYDFGEKLDLSKFRKQAVHYISTMRQQTYLLFLKDFKVTADIVTPDNCTGHSVTIFISEIKRDTDGDIVDEKKIIPLKDLRFREIKDIQNIFIIDSYETHFDSNSVNNTVDKICRILHIVHRINNLRAFL